MPLSKDAWRAKTTKYEAFLITSGPSHEQILVLICTLRGWHSDPHQAIMRWAKNFPNRSSHCLMENGSPPNRTAVLVSIASIAISSGTCGLLYVGPAHWQAPRGAASEKQCSLPYFRTSPRYLEITTIVLCLTLPLFKYWTDKRQGRWWQYPVQPARRTKCSVVFQVSNIHRTYSWSRTWAQPSCCTDLFYSRMVPASTLRHSIWLYNSGPTNLHLFFYGPKYSLSTTRCAIARRLISILDDDHATVRQKLQAKKTQIALKSSEAFQRIVPPVTKSLRKDQTMSMKQTMRKIISGNMRRPVPISMLKSLFQVLCNKPLLYRRDSLRRYSWTLWSAER